MPCNTAAGIIKSDSSKKYQIIDISIGGLSFWCSEPVFLLNEPFELTINMVDENIVLYKMPYKVIPSHATSKAYLKKHEEMKRVNAQFTELTSSQADQLEYCIQNHTISA
jgi:hypothetical protein